jgi:hypothetical protein
MAIWLSIIMVLFLLSPGSTVVFTVQDSQGNPIEGADVSFCARRGITDREGMVMFKDIPDLSNTPYGGCTLSIQKEGYASVTDAFSVAGDMVLTYILYSDVMAVISGTVYFDNSSTPAPFTAIRIYDGSTHLQLFSLISGADGAFSFEISEDRSIYAVVSDYDDQKFYLFPGKEQVLVVNTRGIFSMVSVSVRDPDGRPLPGAQVTLTSEPLLYRDETDEKGTASLTGVTNGVYTLTVVKAAYVTVIQSLTITAPERGGTQVVDVILERTTGMLELEIRTESPLSARVLITWEDREILRNTVAERGLFTLEPGLYTVEVSATGYTPVRRQVLIVEGQTQSVVIELEKTQRTVTVTSEKFAHTGLLLLFCGAGIIGGLLIWWKRRSTHSSPS